MDKKYFIIKRGTNSTRATFHIAILRYKVRFYIGSTVKGFETKKKVFLNIFLYQMTSFE